MIKDNESLNEFIKSIEELVQRLKIFRCILNHYAPEIYIKNIIFKNDQNYTNGLYNGKTGFGFENILDMVINKINKTIKEIEMKLNDENSSYDINRDIIMKEINLTKETIEEYNKCLSYIKEMKK